MTVTHQTYDCGLVALHATGGDCFELACKIREEASANGVGFVLLFFSQHVYPAPCIATAMRAEVPDLAYAGCSSASELSPDGTEEGSALAILMPSRWFQVDAIMLSDVSGHQMEAIVQQVRDLRAAAEQRSPAGGNQHTFAISLIDGMSHAEEKLTAAIHWGLGDIPLVGGSAGDNLTFHYTSQILNGNVQSNAAILLLVTTELPFHIFKTDNFEPTSEKLVITASDPDKRLVREINAEPAGEAYAAKIGLAPSQLSSMSFAAHPLVVRVGGVYFCRSIQKLNPDNSLSFFCAIDDGIVLTMARPRSMVETTREAFASVDCLVDGVDFILGFDCILRQLDAYNKQLGRPMSELYREHRVIGFGTFGEQYQFMHLNQTFAGIAFGKVKAGDSGA